MNCNLIPTKGLQNSRFRSGKPLKLLTLLSLTTIVSAPAFASCNNTNDSVCISQKAQSEKDIQIPSDTCVFSTAEQISSTQNQTSESKETESKTLIEVIDPLFKDVKDDDTKKELPLLLRNTIVVSIITLLSLLGTKIIKKYM